MTDFAIASAAVVGFASGPALRAAIVANLRPRRDPARGRCPCCSAPCLVWRPLVTAIPTALWGRCPACPERVAPPAAVLELSGAGVLGVLAVCVQPALVLSATCMLATAGIVLAVIDAHTHRLPDRVVVPTLAIVAVLLAAAGVVEHRPAQLATAVIGGAATFGFYVLLGLLTGGVGFGDAKAGAVCGLVLGWYGWEVVLWGTTVTFVLAALYLLGRLARGRAQRGSRLALGPFMLLGCLTTLLLVA